MMLSQIRGNFLWGENMNTRGVLVGALLLLVGLVLGSIGGTLFGFVLARYPVEAGPTTSGLEAVQVSPATSMPTATLTEIPTIASTLTLTPTTTYTPTPTFTATSKPRRVSTMPTATPTLEPTPNCGDGVFVEGLGCRRSHEEPPPTAPLPPHTP